MKGKNMDKKNFIITCLVMVSVVCSGCSSSESDKKQETTKKEVTVEQNQKDNDKANSLAGKIEWPSNIPDIVPEFTYGENAGIITNRADNTQWIIAYKNVQDNASKKYAADLKSKGWETTFMGDTLAAEYGSEKYVIALSHFKKAQAAQLNIMKP